MSDVGVILVRGALSSPPLSCCPGTLTVYPDRMASALSTEMLATDLADYLVRRGVPFRQTHHIAGAAVSLAEAKGVQLGELTLQDLQGLHPDFGEDVEDMWDMRVSVDHKDAAGGTSKRAVLEQVATMRARLEALECT